MKYFIIREINVGLITKFEILDVCYNYRKAIKKAKSYNDKIIIAKEVEGG